MKIKNIDLLKKASYTVEASLIIPIYMWILVLVISMAMQLYTEIWNQDETVQVADMWEVKYFYLYEDIGEIVND